MVVDNVEVPPELEVRLAADTEMRAAFDRMPPSHRREYVGYIAEAKKAETRERRAEKTIEAVKAWGREHPGKR